MSSRVLRGYALWFLLYAAAISLYLWYTRANSVPAGLIGSSADPATFMTPKELNRSEAYSFQRNGLFFLAYPWEWGIYIFLLFSGAAGRIKEKLSRTPLPEWVRLPVYAALIAFIAFLAYLPLRFVGYTLSRWNGISTQGMGGWLRDKLVGFGVDALILAVAVPVAYWIIRRGGRWWLKLWLLTVPFTLFLMYIQPVVIDPLYNEFTRLDNPVLETRILELADKADIPANRVFEADMSEKTNAYNAYVNGIGASLRIVLWDTLHRLEEPEILQIVAHEIGHYDLHHLEWSAFGAVASSFFVLWIGSSVLGWVIGRWGKAWGVKGVGDAGSLPVVLLLLSVLSFVMLPVSNYVSRQAERAADEYALQLIGSNEGAVTMNQKLAKATLDDVNPPLLVHWFRSTHPSAMERITRAEAFRQP